MPKMPPNNRMHSSSALQTHGIWTNTIGYDPYAPEKNIETQQPTPNAFDNFQGLMALARLTGGLNATVRGSCRKCNGVGHLTHQCRNTIKAHYEPDDISSTSSESSSESESENEQTKSQTITQPQTQNSTFGQQNELLLSQTRQNQIKQKELEKDSQPDKVNREKKRKRDDTLNKDNDKNKDKSKNKLIDKQKEKEYDSSSNKKFKTKKDKKKKKEKKQKKDKKDKKKKDKKK